MTNQALDIKQYRIKVNAGYHRHVTSYAGENQGYALKGDGRENDHEFGTLSIRNLMSNQESWVGILLVEDLFGSPEHFTVP
ncbi:MAG: hypothetical protein JKY07_12285 [SAR324 cluster bacterium]|nr:hypothetical protein [SAR324 cluster bacterium]